ncbi:MAG: phosphoglucosamine mutase [Oscillospiraceae bacterium]|jgi:phosphoglucosamine mutase|nr:phosphoglucosamine mutase [Oscillospiraceae bacterium]
MGKYFGTDGIRGVANAELDARLAFRAGFAAATVVGEETGRRPRAIIGKDTRISSDMIEAALIAGLCSGGADASSLGVLPTPAIAYLARKTGADLGIVVSASHNPYEHNGIKFFNSHGFKLSDEREARIEGIIDSPEALPLRTHGEMGRVIRDTSSFDTYIDHVAERATGDFGKIKAVVDCANGAASVTARRLFRKIGARVKFIHDRPDGVNINAACGSTHIDALRRAVTHGGCDIGFAFDGDADRCLMIDERGELIDGDVILAVNAAHMKKLGTLKSNAVVGTIVSNSGLDEFGKNEGIEVLRSDVGDRNVIELMKKSGANLGGEASGHTIFLDDCTTGDGQLSAVKLLNILAATGKTASELTAAVPRFPQVIVNAIAATAEDKRRIMASPQLALAIEAAEKALAGQGRILVRPSGTEAYIRVTVEAETERKAGECAAQIAEIAESL